jgi:hypothetical protein
MPEWILRRWFLPQGFQKRLQTSQLRREEENQALTPKNEDIIRIPDIVKCPHTPTKLEKNMVRVVGEYINRTLVSLGWLPVERSMISVWRCRETYVEAGVLCEGETFRVFVVAKVPKNLIQHRISRAAADHLWGGNQIRAPYCQVTYLRRTMMGSSEGSVGRM